MKNNRLILNQKQIDLTIQRLCYQLIENHNSFENSVILGLQPRGVFLAQKIVNHLQGIFPDSNIKFGVLDATFFRDDFRRSERTIEPNQTKIDFLIEVKKVIMIDDVLYSGRSVRSGMDALLAYGRPEKV